MDQKELDKINQKIADRSSVFYWQTDRDITPQQAGQIWADRHRYFTDEELISRVNEVFPGNLIKAMVPFSGGIDVGEENLPAQEAVLRIPQIIASLTE